MSLSDVIVLAKSEVSFGHSVGSEASLIKPKFTVVDVHDRVIASCADAYYFATLA